MAFERGQRIKLLTWHEGLDDPDVEYGEILAVQSDGKLRVALDSGPVISWAADAANTKVVSRD